MLNIKEIVEATDGKLINGSVEIVPKNYVLDSRELKQGDFFIPHIGEKVDSHNFIIDSMKKGIIGFFINQITENKEEIINECIKINKYIVIIEVEDTKKALYNAGKYNREKHIDTKIIAVTGSVGKTSTREMIASVLKEEYDILVTERNYNSCFGIPIMLLKIEDQDICVLEAGIDKFGEMEQESNLLKPDIAVITNIGTAHIGNFGKKENIFSEKIQITNHIKGIKKLVINEDDDLLCKLETNEKYEVLKFSSKKIKKLIQDEEKIKFCTNIYKKEEKITINTIGNHNISNALCAIKVAEILDIKKESIINGISNYKNFSRRLEKINIRDNITLIDDTYNASIDSMKSGLITVNNLNSKRKIAILGDMFDLGDKSKDIHEDLGKIFEKVNYDILYTIGEESKNIHTHAHKYVEEILHFKSKEKLVEIINKIIKDGDIVYFKASNGMNLNEIIEKIK